MFSVFDKYNTTTKEPSSKLEDQYWENEGPFANEPFREDTGYFWLEAWKLMFQWEVELYQISKTQFAVDTDSGLAEVGTLKQIDNSAHLCLLEGFLGESGLTDDKQREQFVELIDKYAKNYKTKNDYEGFLDDMVDGDLLDKILSEMSIKTEAIYGMPKMNKHGFTPYAHKPRKELADEYKTKKGVFSQPFEELTDDFWVDAFLLMYPDCVLYKIDEDTYGMVKPDIGDYLWAVGSLEQFSNTLKNQLIFLISLETGVSWDDIEDFSSNYINPQEFVDNINNDTLYKTYYKAESVDRRLIEMNEYYDDMSLDELPHSAYESLKDWFIGAGREDLEGVGLPEDRIEYILNGGTPDYRDLELAYGGITFVPDDFGWFESKSEVYNTVEEEFDIFVDSMCKKYNTAFYDTDLASKEFDNIRDKIIKAITEAVFQNQ